MRGDHTFSIAGEASARGLPPHAWGPPEAWQWAKAEGRSTPTCVGTTTLAGTPALLLTVYPHMRGDHNGWDVPSHQLLGLPPHAWGPLLCLAVAVAEDGSTPTCVGTTRSPRAPGSRPRVYPHMRGDHFAASYHWPTCSGLPPHAWGPPRGVPAETPGSGSTPTCVGTTSPCRCP